MRGIGEQNLDVGCALLACNQVNNSICFTLSIRSILKLICFHWSLIFCNSEVYGIVIPYSIKY